MPTEREGLAQLMLAIQRMLDAELLAEVDVGALLAETRAAQQSLDSGDRESARQHIDRLTDYTEALVNAEALDPNRARALKAAALEALSSAPGETD